MKLYNIFLVAAGCLMGQMPGHLNAQNALPVNLMKLTGMFQCPGYQIPPSKTLQIQQFA